MEKIQPNTEKLAFSQHFVVFCSPGSFCSETTRQEIASWNVREACEMAKEVVERYGAKPYGFYFITRGRAYDKLDSRVVAESGMYYMGGYIKSLAEVIARNDPKESILLSNMKRNGWNNIIINNNSYKFTAPFTEEDTLLVPNLDFCW